MNQSNSKRWLVLEGLESRCLLAGGALGFSQHHDGHDGRHGDRSHSDGPPHHQGEISGPAEVRQQRAIESGQHRERQSHRRSDSHQHHPRSEFHRLNSPSEQPLRQDGERLTHEAETSAIPPALKQPPSPPVGRPEQGSPAEVIPVNTVSDEIGDNRLLVETPGRPIGSVPSRIPQDPEAAQASDRSNSTLELASTSDNANAATQIHFERRSDDAELATESEATAAKQSWFGNSERQATFKTITGSPTSAVRLDSDLEGTIDSFPLLGSQSLPHTHEESASPWELDEETVQRIGDILREESIAASKSNDEAMAGWFHGPGGFVDVQSDRAPMFTGGLSANVVDIVLKATIGRHRSFELIASSESTNSGSDERDAVLAAIDGEWSDALTPVHDPRVARLSGIAYPGLAIAAGALALANNRNKKLNAAMRRMR